MYEITIKGNTPAELFANLAQMAAANANTAPAPASALPTAVPTATANTAPAAPAPAAAPVAPAAPAVPAPTAPPAVPTAAPTYTLDALARAGAALAQSGKMQEAIAVLTKYGVQTVNQLNPDQYGAVAAELRALGAQI